MADGTTGLAFAADILFRVGNKPFSVTSLSGEEAISSLFSFRLALCTEDANVKLEDMVGKSAVATLFTSAGKRFFNGIVSRFSRLHQDSRLSHYEAEIVPAFWMLSRRIRSRIFQEHNCPDMTVPGIIKKVLIDAGVPEDRFSIALQGKYTARDYVVQYRESELNFISRLMEEEGIFYFFTHAEDQHVMVFGDSKSAHTPIAGVESVTYRENRGMVTEDLKEYVYALRDSQEMRIGTVTLDDYTFQKPSLDLMATKSAATFTSLELSDAPGHYVEKKVGESYAQIRLEEQQVGKRVQQMSAAFRAFVPGLKFTLAEHPVESLNREYVVTTVRHNALQPQAAEEQAGSERGFEYNAEVETIPSDTVFRPARVSPRPFVQGAQTALVVGPKGEEIYTDQYGRVKVQFHWDHEGKYDEKSSAWIRCSQGMAGGQYGIMFLPRVGQEVIVDFLEGNPDCPLVTGRVYNNDQMPPYKLPDHKSRSVIKTHSTKGGGGTNEIRFEDMKGCEQILVFAWKDLHVRTKAQRVSTIGGTDSLGIGGDWRINVYKDRHTKIEGEDVQVVMGDRCTHVGGDHSDSVAGGRFTEIGGDQLIHAKNILIEADTAITIKGPGGFIVGNPVLINSGGAAASVSGGQSKDPKEPAAADKVQVGRDVTYTPGGHEFQAVEVEDLEKKKTFVEFQLLDALGNPVPNEPFEITTPEGVTQTGTTDGQGVAKVANIDVGTAKIRLPRRQDGEWRRLRTIPLE
jgi:type VI secretion system secreted protein VgrG